MKALKVLAGKFLTPEKLCEAINSESVTPSQIVQTTNGRWVCFYEENVTAAKAKAAAEPKEESKEAPPADEGDKKAAKAKAAAAKL